MSNKTYKAEDIALVFAKKATDEGTKITPKKMQKLLYYAQAWNLVFNDKKLFKERIEAWVHGPVVPEVYRKLKSFKYNSFVVKGDVEIPKLDPQSKSIVDDVWRAYGKYDADYLEILTHNEEPWIMARQGLGDFEVSSTEIPVESMRDFYKRKLDAIKEKKQG